MTMSTRGKSSSSSYCSERREKRRNGGQFVRKVESVGRVVLVCDKSASGSESNDFLV